MSFSWTFFSMSFLRLSPKEGGEGGAGIGAPMVVAGFFARECMMAGAKIIATMASTRTSPTRMKVARAAGESPWRFSRLTETAERERTGIVIKTCGWRRIADGLGIEVD